MFIPERQELGRSLVLIMKYTAGVGFSLSGEGTGEAKKIIFREKPHPLKGCGFPSEDWYRVF
jgi:hypothetical protein